MIHTVTMPALSPTMEKGKLAKWLMKKGDKVSPGDVICEIETDKAIMEFEAVDEGIVHEILVPEGSDNIKVHSPILTLMTDDVEGVSSSITKSNHTGLGDSNSNTPKSPINAVNNGKYQSSQIRDYPFSSPLARRIARENNVDLTSVFGSGPHGRIIKKDIDNILIQNSKGSFSPILQYSDMNKTNALHDSEIIQLFEKDSYSVVPHENMRKTIAHRLQQSKQTIPHFYVSIDCNIDNLLSLRAQINSMIISQKEDVTKKVSVNDVILKAFALAMVKVPEANVSWTTDSMLHHKNVDISIAVSIPGGIVTPILRRVNQKNIVEIASETKQLIQRAKKRKLKPEEYLGGTTSISNMGMFGVKSFGAIVNPPQSTILAVGAGEKKPIFKDDKITISNIMNVTLSADHRSVDGAVASELLASFKEYIENPVWMMI